MPRKMIMLTNTIIDEKEIKALAFSLDNKFMVTANHSHKEGSTIKFWDFPRGTLIKSWSNNLRNVDSLLFSPDNKYLLIAGFWEVLGSILFLDHHKMEIKEILKDFDKYTKDTRGDTVFNMTFSQDGKYLASTHDAHVIIWDYKSKNHILVIEEITNLKSWEHGEVVGEVLFSPGGDYLITGADDGLIKMWSFPGGQHIHTFEQGGALTGMYITPDEKSLITCSSSPDGSIKTWNLITRKLIRKIPANTRRLALTPDGRYMIGGLVDNTIKIWELNSGKVIWTTLAHEKYITSLRLSLDSKYFVTTSMDKSIKIWSLELLS